MRPTLINRRRALTIIAAASALPATAASTRPHSDRYTWRGSVMGTTASLTFCGTRRDQAIRMTNLCLAEIERLENIFSLYRDTSELTNLNRSGKLDTASHDMRSLLSISHRLSTITGGKFDPTVQALWRLNADWYGEHAGSDGPPDTMLQTARKLVDYRRIKIEGTTVSLGTNQSITLNGIAQGYITDRVSDLLRSYGWHNMLVNLGEFRALDAQKDNTPFQLELSGSDFIVQLQNNALASSSGSGFVFPSRSLRHTHLIDPETSQSPNNWQSVHVRHPSAVIADGLSTAFSAMPAGQISRTIRAIPSSTAWVFSLSGKRHHFASLEN